jgi:hypothetical protein
MFRKIHLIMLLLFAVCLAGCQQKAKTVYCDLCKQDVKAGAYCAKCNKVMGMEGTVHCAACDKDFPAGTYCASCNCFMLAGTVHCDKCGKDFTKGAYCSKCKAYMGVPDAAYCEKCKAPYCRSKGCMKCQEKG